jgi:hypothetical protein
MEIMSRTEVCAGCGWEIDEGDLGRQYDGEWYHDSCYLDLMEREETSAVYIPQRSVLARDDDLEEL